MKFLLFIAILGLLYQANASIYPTKPFPFIKRKSIRSPPLQDPAVLSKPLLSVRGGGCCASPIDGTVAAKVFGGVLLAHGSLFVMMEPEKVATLYGSSNLDHLNRLCLRRIGMCEVATGLYTYSMLFRDLGIEAATAISMTPLAIDFLAELLRAGSTRCGYNKWTVDFAGALIHVAAVISNAHGLEWAEAARKLAALFLLLHATIATLSTDWAKEIWNIKIHNSEGRTYMAFLALNALGNAAVSTSLAWFGVNIAQALGYSALAYSLSLLKAIYITKEVDLFEPIFKTMMIFFWLPFCVIAAYSILVK